MPRIVVYGRQDCRCSQTARTVLEQHELPFDWVDVSQTAAPDQLDLSRTPVVTVDGRVRFRGEINPILLQRLIRSSL